MNDVGERLKPTGFTRLFKAARVSWMGLSGAFREEGDFERDLDEVIDVLHHAKRADPAQPVLVAGDPENATRAERLRSGIPLPDDLVNLLRAIASRAKTAFLLG